MHCSDCNEACLANCYQRVRDHLGGRMRLGLVGRFLQIQSRAKCRARSPQNDHALLRLIRGDFDGGDEFTKQPNRQRVTAFGSIESKDSDLRRLLFDKNGGHEVNVEIRMTNVELNLDNTSMKGSTGLRPCDVLQQTNQNIAGLVRLNNRIHPAA